MQTSVDDRTNFRFQQTYADGHACVPADPVVRDEREPGLRALGTQGRSREAIPRSKPGTRPKPHPVWVVVPDFIHTQVSAGIDWRRSPGYTRRGGLYEVTLDDYHSNTTGIDSFQKLTGEVIQHVPLLRETWVLAARGRVETTLNDNRLIPYYMLPALGSGSDLRAYATDRFRDRHSMVMNAEFRWLPAVGLDMAVFYDAGKVTSRRNDLSFKGLKSDVGIGARFHGLLATPLRIDFAVGNEGWKLVMAGGPVF